MGMIRNGLIERQAADEWQDPVATPGDLPAAGNKTNDRRMVTDDGDGKQAGYTWNGVSWVKITDPDAAIITLSTGTPPNVSRAAAVTGVSTEAARRDHKHDVDTAAAGTTSVGDAAAEGSAASVARSDHQHAVPAPSAPQSVSGANAAGSASTVARSDHVHALDDEFVTNAKLANMAANSLKANPTVAPAAPVDLAVAASRFVGRLAAGVLKAMSGTEATSLLDVFTDALKGLVPASGGGTDNYMRADGTWAVPPGTSKSDTTTAYAGDSTPYISVNASNIYSAQGTIYFRGTTDLGAPTAIKIVKQASSGSPTHSMRIFDVTNALVVAEVTAMSSTSLDILNMGALANLPTGNALFEIQVKRDSGGSVGIDLYSATIEF